MHFSFLIINPLLPLDAEVAVSGVVQSNVSESVDKYFQVEGTSFISENGKDYQPSYLNFILSIISNYVCFHKVIVLRPF